MKDEEAKHEFEQWHAAEVAKGVVYDFQAEMEAYCKSDVELLQKGCEAFCDQFMPIAGFNPFLRAFTIAGACNLYWRRSLLEPETIAVEPIQGWRGARVNQSKVAFQWLYCCESLLPKQGAAGDRIRHARNGGEVTVVAGHDSVHVDGYDAQTRTIYEFHGCPTCFSLGRDIKSRINGDRTLEEVYQATRVKIQTLRADGYTVVELWECQWKAWLGDETTPQHQFVDSLTLADPLEPRDAFFGGRTGAVSLYATVDATQGETIKYLDVTSLYPWVNETAKYPLKHPKIKTQFDHHRDLQGYFGLAHVDILPPAELFHPVLPVRSGGKLTFPLCAACVREQQVLPMLARVATCAHTDEQRTLRGTWCTPEIEKALDKGYRLIHIHEVWYFEKTQVGLFKDYVNTWLKIKQESAGWPEW